MIRRKQEAALQVEAWLARGGVVLAASDRAARAAAADYHATRQAEGATAWLTPAIFAWDTWARERWLERNASGLMLLNPLQEQALWGRAIRASGAMSELPHAHRLAATAQQAYGLLCDFAPDALVAVRRSGWVGDAAIFSAWLGAFEALCRREVAISASRLPLDLAEKLIQEGEGGARAPLLLIGFDRLLGTQRALLDAWGEWKQLENGEQAVEASFVAVEDSRAELAACVRWLRERLSAAPDSQLMVVVAGLQERRGELERALLVESDLDFEFSLGVPLAEVGLARAAVLLLRWLDEPITEAEVDWLIGCGFCVRSSGEELALAERVRWLRDQDLQRPEWELTEFVPCVEGVPALAEWARRLMEARERLGTASAERGALEWAGIAGELLEMAGWPGFRPMSSVAFQARQRWERVLEDCASLGFDGSRMEWAKFVATLSATVSATIFALESHEAPIQITEPLTSAGQTADGIWFLGADEEHWPGRGQPHPLLPIGLQRETGMPHASPQADWEVAHEATVRLLAAADEVVFSYAEHAAEWEARPSRLVTQLAGAPISDRHDEGDSREPLTGVVEDWSRVPFPLANLKGGAKALTSQSLCPFQAFATARLAANDWDAAEAGLSAKQRGLLLHAVLGRVWSRTREGISTWEELNAKTDLHGFVAPIVRSVMQREFGSTTERGSGRHERDLLPRRRYSQPYLDLEAKRLARLVVEWLEFEKERVPFEVQETEFAKAITVAGIGMKVRIDRVDELSDSEKLIVDYKSSTVRPSAWEGARPDDVQLPLYAAFGFEEQVGGVVFARVRAGDTTFYGRAKDAKGTLIAGLSGSSGLVKNPLTTEQLEEWRQRIERLAEDFVAGKAEVDPKDVVKTCEKCHLHAVCRIYENQPLALMLSGEDEAEEDDETAGGDDA